MTGRAFAVALDCILLASVIWPLASINASAKERRR